MTFKNKYVKTKLSESYTHIIATTAFVKTQAFRSVCGVILRLLHCWALYPPSQNGVIMILTALG